VQSLELHGAVPPIYSTF